MSNIDKLALADDESVKTYYIHPAAFGCTKNPGYRHVPVVHADDFEKQRAKLEVAERESENWRGSFYNERFRADKLAEAFKTEHEQLLMANSALITQHMRANVAESRIAELEAEKAELRPVGVMSEKAFYRLEQSESRFIALWPRPGIHLPRKRPHDSVIVYARVATAGIGKG
ncbi:ead/Ea22-like family protein [Citrobacter sedlakii]|uniref:ead/Ea22-like family protein n=1 Tax=Citrobacter sedlakii TaxID=67826 RepID=UPI00397C7A37